jgi:hypothetical protein
VRKTLGLLALAGVAVVIASVARTDPGHRPLELKASSSPHSLLAFRHGARTTWLARVNPRTLRYRQGRRLQVGGYGSGWSYSPDRSLLALGHFQYGDVMLVDTARLRVVRRIDTGVIAHVAATAWLGSRLLVVLVSCCEPGHQTTLATVDPTLGTVLSRTDLAGSLEGAARSRSALVLLLGPIEGIGPSRLAVVDAEGRVRTAGVGRVHSGRETIESGGRPTGRHARPGLALDAAGDRAFVVGAGAPAAVVDLATLAVDYHELSAPVSLLGRLHAWLEPAAEAKTPPIGPVRQATWLGDGLLAVSGYDSDAWEDEDGTLQSRATPAGLKVIDTRTWSVSTLDAAASSFKVADGLLLASGFTWASSRRPPTTGKGLTAYDANGAVRYHLFGTQPVLDVQVIGNRAFVRRDVAGKSTALVDLRRGRVARFLAAEPPSLVLGAGLSDY